MNALFRALAVHNAQFYKALLAQWGSEPDADLALALVEGLVYDGLWLTKFPLLHTPGYGLPQLDALNKAWQVGTADPAQALLLRPAVDADLVRFVLRLSPEQLEGRVELFFGGRAMNKPLWNYLITWFEHSAVLRGRHSLTPSLLETSFS